MITTTLERIRQHSPCRDGWEKLLKGLGKTAADDEPLPFANIVKINGLDDALWCCRAEPQHAREWELYAVWCSRGEVSADNLVAARDAWDAACDAARAAAWDAAWAAEQAAWDAARDAAWDTAWAAARDAWDAAWAAARAAQTTEFLRLVTETGDRS